MPGENARLTIAAHAAVGLFAGDGLSPQNRRWSWRKQTPSGPEIVWVAPWPGAYYVTVRDIAGQAGSYTVVQPPDKTSACSRTVAVAFSCLSGG